jgi:hypothetical protein
MPSFEEHCRDTERRFGNRFEDVHRWLDELQPTLGPEHRKVRHNESGVQYCLGRWGVAAACAAQAHIDLDENSHKKVGALWVPIDSEVTQQNQER